MPRKSPAPIEARIVNVKSRLQHTRAVRNYLAAGWQIAHEDIAATHRSTALSKGDERVVISWQR